MSKVFAKINRLRLGDGALVVVAAFACYANSLTCPFVFDASSAILENRTIRTFADALWPPPGGSPVGGRPVVNLSLAANYAWGGFEVTSYHVLNILIHALAGLTLMGVIRRTLELPIRGREESPNRLKPSARWIAVAAAVLWTVHPLQTASVTYVVQRAESIVGLFYLLTLYCFIRGAACERPPNFSGWLALSVATCLAGMATKEVMVTAPLIIFLYDRAFIAGSSMGAFRARKAYYAALASTWSLLFYLISSNGLRGGTVGFATSITWTEYAKAQIAACVHYLKLSVWPSPLVFDYGISWRGNAGFFALDAVVMAFLLGVTIFGLTKNRPLGFLGAFFFAILAPTSSVIPVATEVVAEHRMYLPLASLVVLAVLAFQRFLGRAALGTCVVLGLACIVMTVRRNYDYRDEIALWSATVAAQPDNPRAHDYLGQALANARDISGAAREFEAARLLDPRLPGSQNNLGLLFLRSGRVDEAIQTLQEVARSFPTFAPGRLNLARALARGGRSDDAIWEFRTAVHLAPDEAGPHAELATLLESERRWDEALDQYRQAVRLDPSNGSYHFELGNLLAWQGKFGDAIGEYETSLSLAPGSPQSETNLGGALVQAGRIPEALLHLSTALRLDPNSPEAQMNLGNALVKSGQAKEAIAHYRAALALRPDYASAHFNLGVALTRLGESDEAREQFALARQPRDHP